MSKQSIISYLQQNKNKYPKTVLVQKLLELGYDQKDIDDGLSFTYRKSKHSFWSKLIIVNLALVFFFIAIVFFYLFTFGIRFIVEASSGAVAYIFLIIPLLVLVLSVFPTIIYHKYRKIFYFIIIPYFIFLIFIIIGLLY